MRRILRRVGLALAAGGGLLLVVDGWAGDRPDSTIPSVTSPQAIYLTSNPPQWRIGFRLDETRYIATVWVTDDPARPMPAR